MERDNIQTTNFIWKNYLLNKKVGVKWTSNFNPLATITQAATTPAPHLCGVFLYSWVLLLLLLRIHRNYRSESQKRTHARSKKQIGVLLGVGGTGGTWDIKRGAYLLHTSYTAIFRNYLNAFTALLGAFSFTLYLLLPALNKGLTMHANHYFLSTMFEQHLS